MTRFEKYRNRRRRRLFVASLISTSIMLVTALLIFILFVQPSHPHLFNNGELPHQKGTVHSEDNTLEEEWAPPQNQGEQIQEEQNQKEPIRKQVSFLFTGDIMLADNVEKLLLQHGFDYPYEHIGHFLHNADFTLGNLETAVTDHHEAEDKQFTFKSKPEALAGLKEAGFDILQLANNHILDFGQRGLLDTLVALDEVGLKGTGAGRDADEAYRPVIEEFEGMKIAFFSYSRVIPHYKWNADENHPGVATIYDHKKALESITEIKDEVDLIVVQVHWGIEKEDFIQDYQREIAHKLIDAGADMIIGTHPHVMQEFEFYNDKLIAYSLGNFIFSTGTNPITWKTVMLEVIAGPKEIIDVTIFPTSNQYAKPKLMEHEEGQEFLRYMQSISPHAHISLDGKVKPLTNPNSIKNDFLGTDNE